MGWASEMMIQEHNEKMKNDPEYADQCRREWEMEDYCREMEMADETQIDWFQDYKIDYTGYEERPQFDEDENYEI